MSSKRVQVSSAESISDNPNPLQMRANNKQLLGPVWGSTLSQHKAKSTCGIQTKKGSQAQQILFYKQKAHQSFMQVIQIQQLHQQQIEQLKQQYEIKIKSLESQISEKNSMVQILQKNNKHHMFQLEKTLQIQGMELIQCKQTNFSKFDQSSILNFKQILSQKQGDNKIQEIKQNIFAFINNQLHKHSENMQLLRQHLKKQLTYAFQYFKDMRLDLISKLDGHQQLLKKYQEMDTSYKKMKIKFDAIQKDATLISENLRKSNVQKSNLQKKLSELQKQLKLQQNSKQALLKISLKESNNMHQLSSKNFLGNSNSNIHQLSSKNLLANSSNLQIKNTPSRLKPFKSQRDFRDRSNNVIEDQDDEFIDKAKVKPQRKRSQNDSQFNIQDLIAQRNMNQNYYENKLNQKKPQLLASSNLNSKLRKKSFDN